MAIATPEVTQTVDDIARRFGLNPNLVKAIIEVESDWRPYAIRYEPTYQHFSKPAHHAKVHHITPRTEQVMQACSWGLMQVMGATAREMGYNLPMPLLCEPSIGVEYGVRYLASQLARYDNNVEDAVAAYNAGSARKAANGSYTNQSYVTKVLGKMNDRSKVIELAGRKK